VGYTFTVGNAVPEFHKDDFPELWARWDVEYVAVDDAPSFVGDEATGKGNSRSPSYSAWSDFCRSTGLYEFFYDDRGNLHAGHPGCLGISKEDADFVTAALHRYRAKSTLPPGFESDHFHNGPPTRDYHLARLMWLEFWMQWAIKNCETPAIQNT
jgi:hypothetical protein